MHPISRLVSRVANHVSSRLSTGSNSSAATPLKSLHDIDQPFVFDISFGPGKFRFEFFDTASPQNWQLLRPDVVVICYDISQRLSLIHVTKYVSFAIYWSFHPSIHPSITKSDQKTTSHTSNTLPVYLFTYSPFQTPYTNLSTSGAHRPPRTSPRKKKSPFFSSVSNEICAQRLIQMASSIRKKRTGSRPSYAVIDTWSARLRRESW